MPLALELVAGEERADLVLQLRPGAAILGEFVGSDGLPEVQREVHVNAADFSSSVETDSEGRFRIQGLPPGQHFLWTETSEGIQVHRQVLVAEGESVHVRLAPPAGIVRLHGVVRAGGAPLAEAYLHANRASGGQEGSGSSSSSETDAQGVYELSVAGAGVYWIHVQGTEESSIAWRSRVEVPAAESFAFDVSIPLGRISGRVTDASGQPLQGLLVESEPEQHEDGAHGTARALTDAEGRYELLLPAGRHAVLAGGQRRHWLDERRTSHAEAREGGLVVAENGHVRGVDLRLEAGGTLSGSVRNADGTALAFAEIWSENGSVRTELGWCDDSGRFELRGVRPGHHRIGARGQSSTTRELVAVNVSAGETSHFELVLVSATLVHLSVLEGGQPVGSEIEARDAQGRLQPLESGEDGEAWLGPLLPGRYTVSARRDGKRVEREFEVTEAGPGVDLELELVFE